MHTSQKICKILCNPLIWIYFSSILIIFLISLNILSFNNILILYFILLFTGILTIIGICTSPNCSYKKIIKKRSEYMKNILNNNKGTNK